MKTNIQYMASHKLQIYITKIVWELIYLKIEKQCIHIIWTFLNIQKKPPMILSMYFRWWCCMPALWSWCWRVSLIHSLSFCQHSKGRGAWRQRPIKKNAPTDNQISLVIGLQWGSVTPANHSRVYLPIRQYQHGSFLSFGGGELV